MDFEPNEILAAEESITVQVAMDSGAIKHVTPPSCIPRGVAVREGNVQNFMAANGGSIKNYGQARVGLESSENKNTEIVYNVADVTRTLHSTGQICDQGYETLSTRHGAVVLPEGALSQFLVAEDVVAKYPRRNGGLYIAEYKVTAPRSSEAQGGPDTGFGGQGASR